MNGADNNSSKPPLKFSRISNKLVILPVKPLGTVLTRTGLVSASQVVEALQQQKQDNNLRIGDILSKNGYIKPKTADFFAERFWKLLDSRVNKPIGYYFKEAALLNDRQIENILSEQKSLNLKFGEIAVLKGWILPATLEFILEYLLPGYKSTSKQKKTGEGWNVANKKQYEQRIHDRFSKIKLELLDLKGVGNISPQLLDEVLLWTKGEFFLSQKLCQLIAQSQVEIPPEEAGFRVKRLVETRIVKNWRQAEGARHFKNIQTRLLNNKKCPPKNLLETYKNIYANNIFFTGSQEQLELLNLGLIAENKQKLRVANPIYRAVFDRSWIDRELKQLTLAKTADPKAGQIVTTKKVEERKSIPWFNWKNIILLLGFVGILLFLLQILSKRLEVRNLFAKGNQMLRAQEYEAALEEYNKLLEADSNYYQAWANRGYALAGLKQYDKMLASCSAATLIEPQAVYAWNCQGEALHNLQRHQEANAIYDRAIALDPDDSVFWINKSEALISLKQYDESLSATEQAIAILEKKAKNNKLGNRIKNELAIAWNYKGKALSSKEEYQNAIAAYSEALKYRPQYYPAQIGKAVALKQLAKYEESSQEFLNILNNSDMTDRRRAATWFYLGKTLCASSQIDSGIAAFETALKYQPDYQAAAAAKENCR